MTAPLFCQTEGMRLPRSVSAGRVSPGHAIARLHQLPVRCGLCGQGAVPDPLAPGTAPPSGTGSVLWALGWAGGGVGVGRMLQVLQ